MFDIHPLSGDLWKSFNIDMCWLTSLVGGPKWVEVGRLLVGYATSVSGSRVNIYENDVMAEDLFRMSSGILGNSRFWI
jgi:hypothetical protein